MPNTRLRPQRTRIHQQQKTISNTDLSARGPNPGSPVGCWLLTHIFRRAINIITIREPTPRLMKWMRAVVCARSFRQICPRDEGDDSYFVVIVRCRCICRFYLRTRHFVLRDICIFFCCCVNSSTHPNSPPYRLNSERCFQQTHAVRSKRVHA